MAKEKKKAAFQEDASAEEIMRQFDRESATRVWTGKPKIVISVVMALFSIYCIWSTLFSTAALEIRLTAFLGLIVIMGYLTYPASKKHVHANRLPWYYIVIMVIGAAAFPGIVIVVSGLERIKEISPAISPVIGSHIWYLPSML